jgi:long-chain acyl-CoA synthetase
MAEVSPIEKLLERIAQHPEKTYLRQPKNGVWTDYSWAEVGDQVHRMASALTAMGIGKGDVVATSGANTAHWIMGDLAASMVGAANVGLYPKMSSDHLVHVMTHSGAKAIFVGPGDDVANVLAAVPAGVIKIANPYDTVEGDTDHNWDDLVAANEPFTGFQIPADDDLAGLIYTSGTTGNPKGVMITYGNITFAMESNARLFDPADPDPKWFSYLPLAHVFERGVVGMSSLYSGAQISFLENFKTLQRDLSAVAPTRFIAVPLVWSRLQSGIIDKMPEKKLRMLLKIPLVGGMVKNKIKTSLGLQNVGIAVSGAAPLSSSVIEFFRLFDISISQGYGMSENMAYCTADYPAREKPGSVGKALEGCELKIDDNGELLCRHPAVTKGYYKEPEKTAEAITEDGWLRTGDRALIDDEGYVTITGRVKDLFKTDKGKYIAPVPIETKFAENENVESLCLIGSGHKQPVMVLTLSEVGFKADKDEVTRSIEATVAEMNPTLESQEKIAKVVVCAKPWTVDDGQMTPTMKVRRHFIEEVYSDSIPSWYGEDDGVIWL